jgi:hypothetical protein
MYPPHMNLLRDKYKLREKRLVSIWISRRPENGRSCSFESFVERWFRGSL